MKIDNLFFEGDSFFHKLDGGIKLLFSTVWTIFTFSFNDIRIFLGLLVLGFFFLFTTKIPFKEMKLFIWAIIIFTIVNTIFLIIITPSYGSELTGTYSEVFSFKSYTLTKETLFFGLTLSAKYLALFPISLIFLLTTHPSKFASSLNRLKVHYKLCYAVNLTLRYIPDTISEYQQIKSVLMLKGIDFDKEKNIFKKLKNYTLILPPIIKGSLEKIENISNGMDLRSFGLKKKRTWYSQDPLAKRDYFVVGLSVVLLFLYFIVVVPLSRGFYYPL